MITRLLLAGLIALACSHVTHSVQGQDIDSMPQVVVRTVLEAGVKDVKPGETEIRVTFSKEIADGSWSWSTACKDSMPRMLGKPSCEKNHRTCVLRVKLEPGKTYGFWLNSERFKNFKDREGRPAVPYLLAFKAVAKAEPAGPGKPGTDKSDPSKPIASAGRGGREKRAAPPVPVSGKKSEASRNGLAEAQRDVKNLKVALHKRTPEELIAAFIPTGPMKYGGYEYYFNYMANNAIRAELESRGAAAKAALERHVKDSMRLWEAINGPGNTVGDVCKEALECCAETPKLFLARPFTCADLGEATNHFVALGEEAAIKELEGLTSDWEKDHKPGRFSRNERVGWVCRILFQPKGEEPLRPPGFGGLSLPWESMPLKAWPLYPVAACGKSYFVLSEGYRLRGLAEDPRAYLKYCRAHGKFRTERVPVPTRAQALNDLEGLRESDAWKAIKWTDSGQGFSYTFSEAWAWRFIEKQANTIPRKEKAESGTAAGSATCRTFQTYSSLGSRRS